jgi:hypothetical protein
VLVIGNLAAAAGVAVLPFSVYGGLLAENVAACFVQPALAATLPAVVGTGPELAAANAWTSAGNSVLRILGPPAGAFLVVRGDFPVVVLVDAVSYLIAAMLLARLGGRSGRVDSWGAGPDRGRPALSGERVVKDVMAELRAGVAVVARTRMLSGLVATTWVFWAANAALTILLVPLAGASLGWLIAWLGLGFLLGSAVAKNVIIRYATRAVLTVCYASVGACFVVAFAVPALPVIALAGAPGAVISVAVRYRVQRSTPDRLLGRVTTVLSASDASAGVAGALVAPLLGTVTLSAAVLAVAAMAWILLPGGGP